MPDVSFPRKIFIKSQADWHGISADLSNVDLPHINHLSNSVSALNDCIVYIINRRIPSHSLILCLKDKAWFSYDCRKAFLDKQEAYHLWSRNRSCLTWTNFVRLRNTAH